MRALHMREQRADAAKATPHLVLDLRALWTPLRARATRNARGLLWFSSGSALCSRIGSGDNFWRFVLSCPTKETIAEQKRHRFGRRTLLRLRLFLLSLRRNSRMKRNSCIRYALLVFFFFPSSSSQSSHSLSASDEDEATRLRTRVGFQCFRAVGCCCFFCVEDFTL